MPSLVSVHGNVRYFNYREPVAGAVVKIGTQMGSTAADGSFMIPSVTTPYDVRVTYSIDSVVHTFIAQGVTRSDPTFELQSYSPLPLRSGTITGTIAGITFPLPTNNRVRLVAAGNNGGTYIVNMDPTATTGAFSIGAGWRGNDTTRTMNVYAVAYTVNTDTSATLASLQSYGTGSASVTAGASAAAGTITLTTPTKLAATATVTQPVAPSALTLGSAIQFEPASAFEAALPSTLPATMPFFSTLPTGATTYLYASATFGTNGSSFNVFSAPTGGATLTFNAGSPVVLTPVMGATFAASTPFTWDTTPTGTYLLRVRNPAGYSVLTVVTSATSALWPADVLPTSGMYPWSVSHFGASVHVDDLAGPGSSRLVGRAFSPQNSITVP